MGSIIKVEQSSYLSGVIDHYTQNKVGMYSKYLNLTPTFVTYYHLNQIMSRTDTGTGTVASEYGYNSPLRFNRISGLPVYNMPILQPDINYDETGMDIDLDLSDVTLLPNTIKPIIPDFICYTLSNGNKLLFRVNNFRYNTIQSNDFITISLDLKEIGPNADEQIEKLVVKRYTCVFEKIGTEDSCFIEDENIETVNNLVDTINECIETYNDMYWDAVAGAYLLRNQYDSMDVIYDVYLNRFIDETNLLPHPATTLTIKPLLDFVPKGANTLYRKSLLYAIECGSAKFLADNIEYFLAPIQNPHSPLQLYHYNALSVHLCEFDTAPLGADLKEYYDHLLKRGIVHGDQNYPIILTDSESSTEPSEEEKEPEIIPNEPSEELPEENPDSNETESSDSDQTNENIGDSEEIEVTENEEELVATTFSLSNPESNNRYIIPKDEYEYPQFTQPKQQDLTAEEIELIKSYTSDEKYIFNLIMNYMANVSNAIDIDSIIRVVMSNGRFSYFYTPLIIWVLKKNYDRYFKNSVVDANETSDTLNLEL